MLKNRTRWPENRNKKKVRYWLSVAKTTELGQREELHHRGPVGRSLFLPPNEYSSNFTFRAPVTKEGSLKKTVLNKRCFVSSTLEKTTRGQRSGSSRLEPIGKLQSPVSPITAESVSLNYAQQRYGGLCGGQNYRQSVHD